MSRTSGNNNSINLPQTFQGQPAPFLRKTFELVEDASTNFIISWGPQGKSFVVWKPAEFARDLLPKYFKHNNFSSFVRQLNTYGFRKIDPDRWEFGNECFQQGNRDLLNTIHRRKPANSLHSPASASHGHVKAKELDFGFETNAPICLPHTHQPSFPLESNLPAGKPFTLNCTTFVSPTDGVDNTLNSTLMGDSSPVQHTGPLDAAAANSEPLPPLASPSGANDPLKPTVKTEPVKSSASPRSTATSSAHIFNASLSGKDWTADQDHLEHLVDDYLRSGQQQLFVAPNSQPPNAPSIDPLDLCSGLATLAAAAAVVAGEADPMAHPMHPLDLAVAGGEEMENEPPEDSIGPLRDCEGPSTQAKDAPDERSPAQALLQAKGALQDEKSSSRATSGGQSQSSNSIPSSSAENGDESMDVDQGEDADTLGRGTASQREQGVVAKSNKRSRGGKYMADHSSAAESGRSNGSEDAPLLSQDPQQQILQHSGIGAGNDGGSETPKHALCSHVFSPTETSSPQTQRPGVGPSAFSREGSLLPPGLAHPTQQTVNNTTASFITEMAGQLGRLSSLAAQMEDLREENQALRRSVEVLTQAYKSHGSKPDVDVKGFPPFGQPPSISLDLSELMARLAAVEPTTANAAATAPQSTAAQAQVQTTDLPLFPLSNVPPLANDERASLLSVPYDANGGSSTVKLSGSPLAASSALYAPAAAAAAERMRAGPGPGPGPGPERIADAARHPVESGVSADTSVALTKVEKDPSSEDLSSGKGGGPSHDGSESGGGSDGSSRTMSSISSDLDPGFGLSREEGSVAGSGGGERRAFVGGVRAAVNGNSHSGILTSGGFARGRFSAGSSAPSTVGGASSDSSPLSVHQLALAAAMVAQGCPLFQFGGSKEGSSSEGGGIMDTAATATAADGDRMVTSPPHGHAPPSNGFLHEKSGDATSPSGGGDGGNRVGGKSVFKWRGVVVKSEPVMEDGGSGGSDGAASSNRSTDTSSAGLRDETMTDSDRSMSDGALVDGNSSASESERPLSSSCSADTADRAAPATSLAAANERKMNARDINEARDLTNHCHRRNHDSSTANNNHFSRNSNNNSRNNNNNNSDSDIHNRTSSVIDGSAHGSGSGATGSRPVALSARESRLSQTLEEHKQQIWQAKLRNDDLEHKIFLQERFSQVQAERTRSLEMVLAEHKVKTQDAVHLSKVLGLEAEQRNVELVERLREQERAHRAAVDVSSRLEARVAELEGQLKDMMHASAAAVAAAATAAANAALRGNAPRQW